jgi:hypothetical protein
MGKRRKKPLPPAAQAILVWFVFSTLLAMGLLYLRATERLTDRMFQPFALVLCNGDERLETSYRMSPRTRRRDFADARRALQDPAWTLDAAHCVSHSGVREPAPGFMFVFWLAVATSVGCLGLIAWVGGHERKGPARRA